MNITDSGNIYNPSTDFSGILHGSISAAFVVVVIADNKLRSVNHSSVSDSFFQTEKCNFDYDRCYEKRGCVRKENFPLTWISSAIIICTANIFSSVHQVWPAKLWSVSYEYHIKCFTWGTAAVFCTAVIILLFRQQNTHTGLLRPFIKINSAFAHNKDCKFVQKEWIYSPFLFSM